MRRRMGWSPFVPPLVTLLLLGCGKGADSSSDGPSGDASVGDVDVDSNAPGCPGLSPPTLQSAKILLSKGADAYDVELAWDARYADERVIAEVAATPDAEKFTRAMDPASGTAGTARVGKLLPDLFLRLRTVLGSCEGPPSPAVRLAKPDYADRAQWADGWIRVVSHTHTIADIKADAGGKVHANRINWFNGCFDAAGDDAACQQLLLRSFSSAGLQWLMDAAAAKGIASVIVTDHDNVGIWYTDTFRKYNRASTSSPSVVHGLEWTSALGHLTVVGNFLPDVPASTDLKDLASAKKVHTSTPLPPDSCDDTDENHDVNAPAFDGPDAPCKRADHRGHGDDPLSVAQAKASIEALHAKGAMVFANHPTNDSKLEPPMKWQLQNLDLLDGVEVNTPDPTLTNRDAPEYWRRNGLDQGRRWVGVAGTDCHVNGGAFTGDTGCNSFHGLVNLTHMDAPYMWIRPLRSTSHAAINAPDLVVAALREGRVTVVQDLDPAVVVDLGMDVNGDGALDYWAGSTVWACERPDQDEFEVEVRVKPVQTHNYNVSVWRNGVEDKILQRVEIKAGATWTGKTRFRRSVDVGAGKRFGYVTVQVREDKTLATDDDAGFSMPIWFAAPDKAAARCDTRKTTG